MFLQTAGLIGFISLHVPTNKVQFDLLSEDIEHEESVAVFIFHLFGGFAVDGTNDGSIGEEKVDEVGEKAPFRSRSGW